MIIIHEDLPMEAGEVAKALNLVYGIKSEIKSANLDGLFTPVKDFDGYLAFEIDLDQLEVPKDKKALILTQRDLYTSPINQEDSWIFGYHLNRTMVLSVARKRRYNNQPSKTIEVPLDLYIKRVKATAIHEIGHDVINSKHHLEASYVNSQDVDNPMYLGLHCIDNKCMMYESIDITTPKPEEGYLLLGGEKKFDAGLDDLLERVYPNWLCNRCIDSINIPDGYR